MVNVTVADPLALVVPPAVMVAEVPPTVTVRAEVAANPCAVMVALDPIAPLLGLRLVAVAEIVKVVAEVAGLEPSVTITVSVPLGAAGMVKVTIEAPLVPLVPPEVMVAAVPLTLTVSAWLATNP
jgi:hypothetical protein